MSCLHSAMLKSTVNLWQNLGRIGVDRCKPKNKAILERHAAVIYTKEIYCRLSTMRELDRQTDRQTTER